MKTVDAVKRRLWQLCDERKWSGIKLADESGVPRSTVKNIFSGHSKSPEIVTIKKLCDGLGISLPQFFDHELFHNLEQEIK